MASLGEVGAWMPHGAGILLQKSEVQKSETLKVCKSQGVNAPRFSERAIISIHVVVRDSLYVYVKDLFASNPPAPKESTDVLVRRSCLAIPKKDRSMQPCS